MIVDVNKMNAIKPAAYLNADKCALYRTIMRILYKEKEAYNSQLSTAQIFSHVTQNEEFSHCSLDEIKQALTQLTEWGSVIPMQDPREVTTIEEYKNKIYRYSPTEDAIIIERMTLELENKFTESNTLSGSLLIRINDTLKEFIDNISAMGDHDIGALWADLQNDFSRLSKNFSDYLHSFYSVEGEKRLKSVDFLIHKDKFISYLREFISQLLKYSPIVEEKLRKINESILEDILTGVIENEKNIPRIDGRKADINDITERVRNQWKGLYNWFVSEDNRASNCDLLNEYTNEIIRKMVSNAMLLIQLQNSGVSKRQDYLKYMELFAKCENVEEAHRLSAHVFGAMNVAHYKFNSPRTTDSIYENACDLPPQMFEIIPRTREYRPRVKTRGFSSRDIEKAMRKQQYIERIKREQAMVEECITDNTLDLSMLSDKILSETFRKALLSWVSLANQNNEHTGRTDFGRRFKMTGGSKEIMLRFADGELYMPSYRFEFEAEENE